MIENPYMNDYCDKCIYKDEEDHCRLLRIHCGAVIECHDYNEKKTLDKGDSDER